MKQCDNGHFYDETRHASCPYCAANGPQIGKTVAASLDPVGKTVPLTPAPSAADRGKTVAVMKKSIGIDPAVGFVVCIKGPQRGEDFRLRAGRNFIGRGSDMDVSLADDETVSRENHAIISYDDKHGTFMIAPGTGRGITYLNGEQIEAAAVLNAYDKIEVGESLLTFLPLCGENFKWDGE